MSDTLPLGTTIIAGVLAAICAVTDWRQRIVFNKVTYPALLLGLVLGLLRGGVHGLEIALGGVAVGFLPALVAFLAGALGGGDVKLLAALGALVGPVRVVEATLIACVITVLYAAGQLVLRGGLLRAVVVIIRSQLRRARAEEITTVYIGEAPFGAALGVATLLLLTWWYELPAGAAGTLLRGLT